MKKLLCLLLCGMLLMTAAACNREATPTEPTEPPTQPIVEVELGTMPRELKYEGVQLQYWSLLSESDPEAQVLRLVAEDFERTTGADVQLNWLAGNTAGLAELLAGDQQVDIF